MAILPSSVRHLLGVLVAALLLSSLASCVEETREDERPHKKARRPPRVKVSKAEPGTECELIGVVEGSDRGLGDASYETAMKDLRRNAAAQGANYVVLDGYRQPRPNWLAVSGRAYACPPEGAQPQPQVQAESESEACEPQCSPGYTCLHGKCVSACNPRCGAGQRCGANRQCYAVSGEPEPD